MNTNYTSHILALYSVFLLIIVAPLSVYAADSSSFRLYDGASNIADPTPLGSTSFSLNEGGETWIAYPIAGSNFQIVTAPPAAASSSSSSSSSSEASEDSGPTGGSGGGHRGARSNEGRGPSRPAAPEEPLAPVLPGQISDQPDTVSEEVITEDGLPGAELFVPSGPEFTPPTSVPTESVSDVRREPVTVPPHSFDITEQEDLVCDCPEVHTAPPRIIPVPTIFQGPTPSLIVLMIVFGLGYISKSVRPGHISITRKTPSPKKKR